MIERLCIIGVGLIGGSLALALRAAGHCREVVGNGRNEASLRKAIEMGVIDRFELEAGHAVIDADMVVLATPLGSIQPVCEQIGDRLAEGAVLTDVGSVKSSVVESVRMAFGWVPDRFVPGHPIAGTEMSGVEAAFAELFSHRRVLLTPLDETDPLAVQKVAAMWKAAGAEVEETSIEHHDWLLAATSHLPHMLAYGLVDCLARMGERDEIFRYAAGGFRDFTRIASSDPVMWRDVCLANRYPLLSMLRRYRDEMDELARAIAGSDGEALRTLFERAKTARDRFAENEIARRNPSANERE